VSAPFIDTFDPAYDREIRDVQAALHEPRRELAASFAAPR
jgi:hypothetical protein